MEKKYKKWIQTKSGSYLIFFKLCVIRSTHHLYVQVLGVDFNLDVDMPEVQSDFNAQSIRRQVSM